MARPPGPHCPTREGWGPASPGPRRGGAGEFGRGRGGRPRRVRLPRVARRRLGAVPGIGGGAPLRVRWPRGLGCGRPPISAPHGQGVGACAQIGGMGRVVQGLGGSLRLAGDVFPSARWAVRTRSWHGRRKAGQPVGEVVGRQGQAGTLRPRQGPAARFPTPRPSLERLLQRLQEPSRRPEGRISRLFALRPTGVRIMSDNATLSDIAAPRQAGRITQEMS